MSHAEDLMALNAAEREGVPFLYWKDADEVQHILMLPPGCGHVTIGRRTDQRVSLHWDREVSRIHALLDPAGEHWTLVDEGSSNGSFVNGDRVTNRRRLEDKDRMCFGETGVNFRDPEPPEGSPSTTRAPVGVSPSQISPEGTKRKVLIALTRPLVVSGAATPATNKQIGDELHLGEDSVKAHLRELYTIYTLQHLPQNEKRARLAAVVIASKVIAAHEY